LIAITPKKSWKPCGIVLENKFEAPVLEFRLASEQINTNRSASNSLLE